MSWDSGVQHYRAFSPYRALMCEAVAAIPSTGGTVTSLFAVGVGVVIATVLDVARIALAPVLPAVEAVSETFRLRTFFVT